MRASRKSKRRDDDVPAGIQVELGDGLFGVRALVREYALRRGRRVGAHQTLPGVYRSSSWTGGRRTVSERPVVQRQMVFAEGGKIEPEEGPVGTSLEDFGADIDHHERRNRIEQASASEFGVDGRPEVRRTENGEQEALFTSADEDQRTLRGEQAVSRLLF